MATLLTRLMFSALPLLTFSIPFSVRSQDIAEAELLMKTGEPEKSVEHLEKSR